MKDFRPSSKDLREMGNVFKRLGKRYPNASVNMMSTAIPDSHDSINYCGTYACHAGWYAFSKRNEKYDGCHHGYEKGSDMMAKALGFSNANNVLVWARENKELWGNSSGEFMFSSDNAFNKGGLYFNINDEFGALKIIGTHWCKVANRVARLERKGL